MGGLQHLRRTGTSEEVKQLTLEQAKQAAKQNKMGVHFAEYMLCKGYRFHYLKRIGTQDMARGARNMHLLMEHVNEHRSLSLFVAERDLLTEHGRRLLARDCLT